MRKLFSTLATLLAFGVLSLQAQTLYWSNTGTWNTTNTNWGTVTGGPYNSSAWVTNDNAQFEGTAGTVTVGAAVSATNLTITKNNYVIGGANTITLNGTPVITNGSGSTNTTTEFDAPISAAGLVTIVSGTTGTSTINVGSVAGVGSTTNAFGGGITITSGQRMNGNVVNAFGTSGNAGTITVKPSGFVISSISGLTNVATNTVYNPIALNPTAIVNYAIAFGATKAGALGVPSFMINYAGAITEAGAGTSTVYIANAASSGGGGAGATMFSSASNTYKGQTIFGTSAGGFFQCGVDNCFPQTNRFVYGASGSGYGLVDLNNHNITIGSLESNSTTGSFGITNTGNTLKTITINGGTGSNAAATFSAVIGANPTFASYSYMAGSPASGNDSKIALTLGANAGSLTLTGLNTFTGGLNLTGGTLVMGIANALSSSLPVTLNGGTFSSGATTGFTQSLGTLALTGNSTINLGTTSHTITFANSSAIAWTSGKTLTITGWAGTAGGSGTAGQIFVGVGGLTTTQLAQINFSTYGTGAMILGTGELVPFAATITASVSVNPNTGSEAAGTTYVITVSTSGAVATTSSVNYTISGTNVTSGRFVGSPPLSGTITILAGQSSATNTINYTVFNDNIFEGLTTATVTISNPTGSIAAIGGATDNFTITDDAIFYWNGGTPANNPATGGTGTWSTANNWIAPVNTGTGSSQTWQDGYPAVLAATAGTVTVAGTVSPTSTSVQTTNYDITSGTSTNATMNGSIALNASVNLNFNDPTVTGNAGANARTFTLNGTSFTGGANSSISVAGAQTGSTAPSTLTFTGYTTAPVVNAVVTLPVIINGTGAGGYAGVTATGAAGTLDLQAGVQLANTNVATAMIGGTSGSVIIINGITASNTNLSPVEITNKPAGSGKPIVQLEGSSNYYGPTYLSINSGSTFTCENANALSPNSVLIFGAIATAGQGPNVDISGFDQTIAGLNSVNSPAGFITNNGASGTNTLTINQTTNTNYSLPITKGPTADIQVVKNGVGGDLILSGVSTFTGGLTINAGTVEMGVANALAGTLPVTLSGGTFSTGTATGYTQSLGTLTVSSSSTINLAGSAHSLTFANSSGTSWGAGTLTIVNWTGTAISGPGTNGRIFVGTGGLTTAQLAQVSFTGFGAGAVITAAGELVPAASGASVANVSVSPTSGSEAAGTTYVITVTTSANVTVNSAVTYTLTGTNVNSGRFVGSPSLTGTINVLAGSNTGTASFTVYNDNIFEGLTTATVTISAPTGDIGSIGTATGTFTITDVATFYWNGGTPANNPATGGNGTWTTASTWIAPVNDGSGTHQTWVDGYAAVLPASAGTLTLAANVAPTGTTVNATNYDITSGTSSVFTMGGSITLANNVNLNINDPLQTGNLAANLRTLTLSGTSFTGTGAASFTVEGAQTGSTAPSTLTFTAAAPTISVPVILNGTGAGGFVGVTNTSGVAGTTTLSGGVQIANTNVATCMIGGTTPSTISVNGITASNTNLSPVEITNKPAGSGKPTVIFTGTSNYYGPTYLSINSGSVFQCGSANCLSPNSEIIFGAILTAGQGPNLDLNGFNQTIAGLGVVNAPVGAITNNAASGTATLTDNQSINSTFSRIITKGANADIAFVMNGTGNLTFTTVGNTFTGGLTINSGTITIGATGNILANALPVTINGGTLATAFNETTGTLNLGASANSAISFTGGTPSLKFTNSSAIAWNASGVLTVNGWTGTAGGPGATAHLFVGTTSGGLTTAQLAQINFTGYNPGAMILVSGEVVPLPPPTLTGVTQVPACAGALSTINLAGLQVSSNFNVDYSINGVAQAPVAVSSNAGGAGSFQVIVTAGMVGQSLVITDMTNTGTGAYATFNTNNSVTLSVITTTAPTTQDNNITFSSIAGGNMTITWTNGNGGGHLVKMNILNSFTAPVDNNTYTANAAWQNTGEQVVYNGASNTVTVTGLNSNIIYWVEIYGYNNTACGTAYNTGTASDNPIPNAFVWTGTISTNWGTATNWNTGVVPPNSCSSNIYIQSGTPFSPTLGTASSVGDIFVGSAATLTLNANLSVCGGWTGGNTTTATVAGAGIVVLNGAAAQKISGNTTFNELRLNNSLGAAMQAGSKISIGTSLDLQAGNFNSTNGAITFTSNSVTQIAILDNFSAGYAGTFTGNITAQRYYGFTYNSQHMLGSPVNAPSMTQMGATGTSGYIIPLPNCDEQVSAANSPWGTVFSYHESNGSTCGQAQWYVETAGNANNAQGYSVVLAPAYRIFALTGAPNLAASYSQTTGNSNWNNTTLQNRHESSGWMLMSNPYLATLNLTTSNAGFDNQVQVWEANGPHAGSYQAFSVNSNAVIAPFQAFMVHKTSVGGSATYSINATDRTRSVPSTFYNMNDNELDISLQNNSTSLLDETTIAFNSNATDGFDPAFDANKFGGSLNRHTLYTLCNGNWMSRNVLNSINTTSTVDMGLEPGATGSYTMTFTGINSFDASSYIYLEDKQTGTMVDVRSGNGTYNFNADSADNWNRFVLHFTPPVAINTANASCTNAGNINITQPGTANWNYTITDANNQVIASGILNQTSPVSVNAQTGTYTLTLVDNNNYTVTKTITVNGAQDVVAGFTASATTVNTQTEVGFTSTSQNASTYVWNFGDGTSSTSSNPNHVFAQAGTFVVTLTVTSQTGCVAMVSQTIHVSETATGIANVQTGGIKMWSSDNHVYVDFTQTSTVNATIKIYNVLGQELSIDKLVSSLIYEKIIDNIDAAYVIVSVRNNDEFVTKKLFITNIK